VTGGPELIAGFMSIRRNNNGRNKPRVVATIIAENIAVPNAKISRPRDKMPKFHLSGNNFMDLQTNL
jgi:hypothetical protein